MYLGRSSHPVGSEAASKAVRAAFGMESSVKQHVKLEAGSGIRILKVSWSLRYLEALFRGLRVRGLDVASCGLNFTWLLP